MKDKFNFLKNTDIFSHIVYLKYLPRWLVLLADILLCVIAYYISFYLSTKLMLNEPDQHVLNLIQR